jgi:peroxiredoxin Q/BCP
MLNVGEKAPDFSLPSDSGGTVSLNDLLGQTLVLYFYPRADTPGCTSEANQFRDASKEFEKLNTRVVGVSGDPVDALVNFRDKYKLNFPLLGDESHQTLEAYGVWQEKNMYGKKSMGVVRTTYVIRKDGRVSHVFPKVKVEGHINEVLDALKQAG